MGRIVVTRDAISIARHILGNSVADPVSKRNALGWFIGYREQSDGLTGSNLARATSPNNN